MEKSLGFHRKMAALLFGEASPAVKFLDAKIKVDGPDAEVIVPEEQLVALLCELHANG